MIGDINDSYDDSRTREKSEHLEDISPELLLTLPLNDISSADTVHNIVGNSILVY